ncbi:hypothetical protein RKD52_002058 [Metabacillus sp. SLBN-84]
MTNENEREDLCDECSFHKKLTFSEKEELWLCESCASEE